MGIDKVSSVPAEYLEKLGQMAMPVKKRSWELLECEAGERFIDIGCGPGVDVVSLRRMSPGSSVFGMDMNLKMLCRAVSSSQCEGIFIQGSALKLPFCDETFNGVRSERMLQHIEKPELATGECARVLKPGGRMVLVDTDHETCTFDSSFPHLASGFMDFHLRQLPNPLSGRRLRGLCREAGMIDITVESFVQNTTSFELFNYTIGFKARLIGAVSENALTPEDAQMLLDNLVEKDSAGTFFASLVLHVCVGKKP